MAVKEKMGKEIVNTQNTCCWYAVYTRPRSEKLVFERVSESGMEVFLPLQKTIRQWSDRKKVVEVPLLSSYVFVRIKQKQFSSVYRVAGFVKFVNFEGKPVPIPQRQIDNLKLIVNSDAVVEVTSEDFEAGDQIEVITGSLTGLTGELIRIGRKKRVVVRIDSLEKNIILTIPSTFLRKL
ncbi:MAG: UpxY family transcription antiterminator [Bacteroidales bacterium]